MTANISICRSGHACEEKGVPASTHPNNTKQRKTRWPNDQPVDRSKSTARTAHITCVWAFTDGETRHPEPPALVATPGDCSPLVDYPAREIAKLADDALPSFDSAKSTPYRSSSTSSTSSSGEASERTRRRSSIQYFGLQVNVRSSFNTQIEMHEYHGHEPSDDATADESPTSQQPMPHGEVGEPAAELARNLPELVENLKRLRIEMQKCNRIYEAINLGLRASGKVHADELSPSEERASVYPATDYSTDSFSRESSLMGKTRDTFIDGADYDAPNFGPPVTVSSFRASSTAGIRRSQQLQKLPRPSMQMPRMSSVNVLNVSYTVMWVSGECGISLRNFSSNKIGAQIAVLQQADGVTTGISNCRLGDQLITVNDDQVEDMRFTEIVQKLKSTRRPITLGFRMNQNIQTSPTASSRSTVVSSGRSSSTRGFFGSGGGGQSEYDEFGSAVQGASILDQIDRQTYSSMRSSTSTLSDDVEMFCKEQEEMHSEIIVLLTETVMSCESLQQENHDQLQNLMQLAPNLTPETSSEMAKSSLAPVSSPAIAAGYAKLRGSTGEAGRSSFWKGSMASSA